MRAVSVAKLTDAEATPGTFLSAFSTRATHDAQVMPPMPMSITVWPARGSVLICVMVFFGF